MLGKRYPLETGFPTKASSILAIFTDDSHNKCPWLAQHREVSTQRVRAKPKRISISIQAETFKALGPFKRECIQLFLIKSVTLENAFCMFSTGIQPVLGLLSKLTSNTF